MRYPIFALLAAALAFAVAPGAVAQKKTTQKKKPATAAQKKPTKPPVLGTTQMAGDQAVVGVEYTVGKSDPMNIKITKVEYRADRMYASDFFREPDKAHKLLHIAYTLHNPKPVEAYVSSDTFHFTVVDLTGENHVETTGASRPETGEGLSMPLKPGQKVNAYALMTVPAKGDIEKLIVEVGDGRVLRYALTGKIKPLDAAWADPSDKSGCTPRTELPGKVGVTLPLFLTEPNHQDAFDVTVDGISTVTTSLTDDELPEGTHNIVVAMRVKNASRDGGKLFRFDSVLAELQMEDGSTVEARQRLVHATANRDVDFKLAKDAEVKFRIHFEVPTDSKAKTLVLRGPNAAGRSYVFPL
jgi:hypothetical protein